MAALTIIALLVGINLVSKRWGVDSRDSNDWHSSCSGC